MQAALLGVIASLAFAALAYARSRAPGGFYDADIYGMTAAGHRRYALGALILAGAFAVATLVHSAAMTFALFAALTLAAVFYVTSFLRGASEPDE